MKQLKFLAFTLLAGAILFACQDEPLGQGPDGPEGPVNPVGEDVAALTLKIGSVRTRADQDDPVELLGGEAEVKSVACFVRTKDLGNVGEATYKQGVFRSFLITNESEIVHDENDPNTTLYTINLEVHTPSVAGKTDVAIVANYKENGLEDALGKIESWDELFDLVTTTATAAGMKTPLLMFGYQEVALTYNGSSTASISLQRLVSRFDIENKAADAPKKPFLLQSAEIINPKQYSYLLPGNEDTYNIPVLESGFTKVNSTDNKNIKGLYTYEAANDGSVAHTALLIRGTLGGEAYVKRIDLMKDGQIIALERNTRYLITLTPAADQSGIDWSFTVDDWSEGTVIPVKPEYQRPVASNMTFEDATGQAIGANTWNSTMKACLLGAVTAGDKIKFTVDNLQNTNAVITFINGDWADLGITDEAGKKAFITRNTTSIESKATLVKEEYTITFPAAPSTAFEMEIRLESETKPGYYESFRLIFLPEFACMVEEAKMFNAAGTHIPAAWDQATKSFQLAHQQANTKITFKVKTFHSSEAQLEAVTGNLSDLGITASSIQKTGSIEEGNYVTETYEVVFPTLIVKTGKAKVTIANTLKPEEGDEFYLDGTSIAIYPATNTRGVLIGNLIWAPVNVGATNVDNTTPAYNTTGYHYQWGRTNSGFDISGGSVPTAKGPIAWGNRNNGTFYYNVDVNTQRDWLTNSGTDRATRDAYWSTPSNTPCPEGWRLPTKAEADQLSAARNGKAVQETAQKRWKVTGDDGQALYFPITGWISYTDGSVNAPATDTQCRLWTSEKFPSNSYSKANYLNLNGTSGVGVSNANVPTGHPLRCVKSL